MKAKPICAFSEWLLSEWKHIDILRDNDSGLRWVELRHRYIPNMLMLYQLERKQCLLIMPRNLRIFGEIVRLTKRFPEHVKEVGILNGEQDDRRE